jgi:hypothetical protein
MADLPLPMPEPVGVGAPAGADDPRSLGYFVHRED